MGGRAIYLTNLWLGDFRQGIVFIAADILSERVNIASIRFQPILHRSSPWTSRSATSSGSGAGSTN